MSLATEETLQGLLSAITGVPVPASGGLASEETLAAIAAAVRAGVLRGKVVYAPGGVAGNGVYTTWAGAYAAAAAQRDFDPEIIIDGSLGTPEVTAGTYDVSRITLSTPSFNFYLLTILDGAVFTLSDSTFTIDGLTLQYQSTSAPTMTLTSGMAIMNLFNQAGLNADVGPTKPFVKLTGTADLQVYGHDGSYTAGLAAAPVFDHESSGTLDVAWDGGGAGGMGAGIGANTFAGAGTITVQIDPTVVVNATQTAAALSLLCPAATLVRTPLSLSAAGGARALPARPAVTAAPGSFLAVPSGNQASATTYTLQVAGAYKASDIVRILFTKTQLAAADVTIVDGGSGTPTIGKLLNASTPATTGQAYLDVQLNAAGSHWTSLGGGYL